MRVLFTSPILEHPPAGGPELRIANSIKALSSVAEVDIVSGSMRTRGDEGRAAREHYAQFAEEFHHLPETPRPAIRNPVLRRGRSLLARAQRLVSYPDAEFLVKHADRRKIDVVWFGYGNISYPLIRRVKKLRPGLKVVCDTDSVWSRYLLRELPYAQGPRRREIQRQGQQKEREERAWVDLCDVTTAVSEVDADYYRSIATDPRRIRVFSNVIDLATYAVPPPPPSGHKRPAVYLAGTFGRKTSAMNTAGEWMLSDVMPLVWRSRPDAHLYLVGKNSDASFGDRRSANVTVTGKLDSVLPYLCHADVAVVPLKYESGTRFKILEAGACLIPVVSTTLGAEGIPLSHETDILIADEADDFATAILRVIDDRQLARGLAERCRALVESRYSVGSLADEAKSILDQLRGP